MAVSNKTLSIIVKLNFLLLGFGLVVYLIWYLNHRGLPEGAQELIGLEATQINICRTRVKSVELVGIGKIFEENMVWKAASSDGSPLSESLNQVAVEKWFGKYCSTNATEQPEAIAVGTPLEVRVSYVEGPNSSFLYWLGADLHEFGSQRLVSTELSIGLKELTQLAGLKWPGSSGQ